MNINIFFSRPEPDCATYTFKGASGKKHWPKSIAALGPGGLWNILWRAGYLVSEPTSDISALSGSKVAFLHLSSKLTDKELNALETFISSGGQAVVTGKARPLSLLPDLVGIVEECLDHHRILAPLIAKLDQSDEFHAPPNTEVFICKDQSRVESFGSISAGIGERQSPERAIRVPIKNAPVAIRTRSLLILNGDPFSGYQALLQGHSSVITWANWRHRMFWLDEHAAYIVGLLRLLAPNILNQLKKAEIDLPGKSIVYRHDVDNSRDSSFLDTELKTDTPATHAILLDKNRRYWNQLLGGQPILESAFHYNTGRKPSLIDIIKSKFFDRVVPIRPDSGVIAEGGLLRQVRNAKAAGIGVQTLHRHLAYHYYPESIESLGGVYEAYKGEILGACSLFRAKVIRWGELAEVGEMPDPQFPCWYPFRLFDASINKLLNGWEMTALVEPEPELVKQMLEYENKSNYKRVYTIIFHPAHANTNTFVKKGTLNWFKKINNLSISKSVPKMTLKEIFMRCEQSCQDKIDVR